MQPAAVAAWVVHWRIQGERPVVVEGAAALPLAVLDWAWTLAMAAARAKATEVNFIVVYGERLERK